MTVHVTNIVIKRHFNQIIVCGLDTLGQSACNTLRTEGRPFVVVEQNQAWIQEVADKFTRQKIPRYMAVIC